MKKDFIIQIVWLVVFALVQVLVLNHVRFFGCATPLLYVYFVILMPRGYPQWAKMLWAFILGLVIDTFSNTPGVASGSMTLVAALQPFILRPFLPRDADENLKPGIATLGFGSFSFYAALLTLILCIAFFSLEMLSFFNWLQWIENVFGSALLTFLLLMVIENVRSRR